MGVTVVVRNRVSIPVPEDSLAAWRVVCQALGHRLFWDERAGVLHLDSHLDGWKVVLDGGPPGGGGTGSRQGGDAGEGLARRVAAVAARRFSRLGAEVVLADGGDGGAAGTARRAALRAMLRRLDPPLLLLVLRDGPHRGGIEVVYHLLGGGGARRLAASLGLWLGRQAGLPCRGRPCLLPAAEEGYGAVLAGASGWGWPGRPPRLAALVHLGSPGEWRRGGEGVLAEACAEGLVLGVLDFLMECAAARGELRLLEAAGVPALLPAPRGDGEGAPPPIPAARALPAPGPAAAATAASPPGPGAHAAGVPEERPAVVSPGLPPPGPVVVGGSVPVPGPVPAYVSRPLASGSVGVPGPGAAAWPAAPRAAVPRQAAAAGGGQGPSRPWGEVQVRQPFG